MFQWDHQIHNEYSYSSSLLTELFWLFLLMLFLFLFLFLQLPMLLLLMMMMITLLILVVVVMMIMMTSKYNTILYKFQYNLVNDAINVTVKLLYSTVLLYRKVNFHFNLPSYRSTVSVYWYIYQASYKSISKSNYYYIYMYEYQNQKKNYSITSSRDLIL